LLERAHVDLETVFHAARQHSFLDGIDLVHADHFDVRRDRVLAAEIEHLLALRNPASVRRLKITLPIDGDGCGCSGTPTSVIVRSPDSNRRLGRLADLDGRIVDEHGLARANLARLAQFDLAIHLDLTHCDARLRGASAIRETHQLEQVMQFDVVAREREFESRHGGFEGGRTGRAPIINHDGTRRAGIPMNPSRVAPCAASQIVSKCNCQ
jgi:BMFP domain-containing protein YqiC